MEMKLCDCSKFVLDCGYCMCMYLPALIGSSRHRTRRSSSSLFKLQPFTSFFSLVLFRSRGNVPVTTARATFTSFHLSLPISSTFPLRSPLSSQLPTRSTVRGPARSFPTFDQDKIVVAQLSHLPPSESIGSETRLLEG
jgi:hypothetical protein